MDGTENTNTTTQGTETGAQNQTDQQNQQNGGEGQQQQNTADFEKMLQSALDRERNKHGNEMKKLRDQIEKLTKEHLTESERAELERQQEREQFERERAEFKLEKNKLFAIKAIEEAGLKDGKGSSSSLVDFVMADSEEAITERVKAFGMLIEGIVKVKVDEIFKTNGRTPGVGSDSGKGSGDDKDSLAVRMGKNAAQTNQKARSVLDHYIGGK